MTVGNLMMIIVISAILVVVGVLAVSDYAITQKMVGRFEKACKELEKKSEEIKWETKDLNRTIRVEVSESVLEYLNKDRK